MYGIVYVFNRTFYLLTASIFFPACVERLFNWFPLPGRELDRLVHKIPDGASTEEGIPRNEKITRNAIQNSEGERAAGTTTTLRYVQFDQTRMLAPKKRFAAGVNIRMEPFFSLQFFRLSWPSR